jgi:hypothetical protein
VVLATVVRITGSSYGGVGGFWCPGNSRLWERKNPQASNWPRVPDEWAWEELNYRPHAYQTETERWPALLAVDSAKLTRYVADWRWLALTRFVTTDDTTRSVTNR